MADRFLIAPFKSGIQKNVPVWQTPEDSFEVLKNAYIDKGVVRKRTGSVYVGTGANNSLLGQLKSRLRVSLGPTSASGNITGTVPGAVFKAGQMFSVGTEIFTVQEAGTPVVMLTTGASTVHTYHTSGASAGNYDIQGAAIGAVCYFYPSEPVMGFGMHEVGSINDHPAISYDTQFAYKYSGGGWGRVGTQVYTGDNLDYFWTSNFAGVNPDESAMFSTNFNKNAASSDNMYYTLDAATWTVFNPKILVAGAAPQNTIITAKIIIPFKSRLLLFNTYEYENKSGVYAYKEFSNRLRFSSINNPLHASSFLEPKQTGYLGGGYIDAPTEEDIVSVAYIKDTLIVYFERSTYELSYIGDVGVPFVWRKINSELGSESTFASVSMDDSTITIGSKSVHACNGVSSKRIDQKIPDEISKFLNVSGAIKRIHSVKDLDKELIYWTIPNQQANDSDHYPDTLLVYNYGNQTWAMFDDCITAFGYLEQALSETWEEDYQQWIHDLTAWNSGVLLSGHRKVMAGNQHGFTFLVLPQSTNNAATLQVNKISGSTLFVNDHNLHVGDYIRLYNSGVAAEDVIYRVSEITTDDEIVVEGVLSAGYNGGATISRVSRIDIKSSAWNPYSKKGMNASLGKISFAVAKTARGEITVSSISSFADGIDTIDQDASLGTNVLDTSPYALIPLEQYQDLLWHDVYFQASGNSIKMRMYFSDEQILSKEITDSNFEMQGMLLLMSSTGYLG